MKHTPLSYELTDRHFYQSPPWKNSASVVHMCEGSCTGLTECDSRKDLKE